MVNHIVLAKVTSKGSGGRAEVVAGHPITYEGFSDPFLTSQWFTKFEVGQQVIATVCVTPKRRRVTIVEVPGFTPSTINKFFEEHGPRLVSQALREQRRTGPYIRWHNILKNRTGQDTSDLSMTNGDDTVNHTEPVYTTQPVTPKEKIDPSKFEDRIYISDVDNKALEVVHNISKTQPVNVMMVGPSGYGKSSIPKQKAKDWEMNFLRWDCATVRDQEEFFGFRGALDGSTMDEDGNPLFTPSKFAEAVMEGNYVIVLDELNRIDPYILNILFPILDHEGKTSVAGFDIEVGPNIIFFATINVGFQFTGTFQLDTALSNRFLINIEVGAMPTTIEKMVLISRTGVDETDATLIVKLMTQLRKLNKDGRLLIDASTRVSLQLATLIHHGMDVGDAINFGICNKAQEDERKEIIDAYRSL